MILDVQHRLLVHPSTTGRHPCAATPPDAAPGAEYLLLLRPPQRLTPVAVLTPGCTFPQRWLDFDIEP